MRERIPFQPLILIERFLELLDHRLWRLGQALPMDRACSVAALVAAQTAEFILAAAIARFQAALTRAARRHRRSGSTAWRGRRGQSVLILGVAFTFKKQQKKKKYTTQRKKQ